MAPVQRPRVTSAGHSIREACSLRLFSSVVLTLLQASWRLSDYSAGFSAEGSVVSAIASPKGGGGWGGGQRRQRLGWEKRERERKDRLRRQRWIDCSDCVGACSTSLRVADNASGLWSAGMLRLTTADSLDVSLASCRQTAQGLGRDQWFSRRPPDAGFEGEPIPIPRPSF